MISSVALRYFVEVIRCGSFRAAADHLFVAPSAISRQITLLEDEVGAPVLERGRGRSTLRLTAAGEALMHHARSIANDEQRLRSQIESLKGLRKGEIRLGVPETFSRDFIPEFLVRFNTQYPGITYHVHVAGSARLLEMVASDELDLALSFNPPPVADIKHLFERAMRTCVLMSHDHPLAQHTSLHLSDCAEYGFALPDVSISAKRHNDEMFAKARIRPRAVLVSNSYELLRSASAAGLSIALVNQHLHFQPGKADPYCYVPLDDPRVKPQHFTLCVHEGRTLPVAVLTFIEQLLSEFAQLEPLFPYHAQ